MCYFFFSMMAQENRFDYENPDYLEHLNRKDDLWYEDVLRQVLKLQPQRVLELGCGDGAFTARLTAHGIRVLAVDNSRTFLEYARKHHASPLAEFKQVNLDKQGLQGIKERFEAVVLIDVLEHLVHRERLLGEIAGCLQPGGHFVFQCPNLYSNLVSQNYVKTPANMFHKLRRAIRGRVRLLRGAAAEEITTVQEGLDYKIADHDAVVLTSPYWFLHYFRTHGWNIRHYTTFSFSTSSRALKWILGCIGRLPWIRYLGGRMIFVVQAPRS